MKRSSTIYDFVAEEVYRSLTSHEQALLRRLALAPRIDSATINSVFGSKWRPVIASLSKSGLLGQTDSDEVDLHPLLRAFLLGSLRQRMAGEMVQLAGRLVRHYCDEGAWDEAFAVADAHDLPHVIPELPERSLQSFLTAGRWATIETWLDCVADGDEGLPERAPARAECSFRPRGVRSRASPCTPCERCPGAQSQGINASPHRRRAGVLFHR